MTTAPIFYKTTFPPIDLEENIQTKLLVAQPPTEIRYITYPATSFSQSNAVFNIIPPNNQTIVSRLIRIQVPFTVSINGTLNTAQFPQILQANVVNTLYSGFSDFPIHKSMSTLTLILNNQSTMVRPSQIIDKLLYYCMGEELVTGTSSQTPSQLDNSWTYDMMSLFVTSPFGSYGDSVFKNSRNSMPMVLNNPVVTPSSPTATATINATFVEPLMISPLIFDELWIRKPGLTQLTQIIVNITWDPVQLQRVFRHASATDPVTWNTVTVTLGQPQLIVGYYTLPSYMTIPPNLTYNYSQVQNFIYQPNSTVPGNGGSLNMITNNVQFQSIPRRIYLAVQRTNKTLNDPDAFLPITNLSLTWMNTSGILSTLQPFDLYLVSRKNGLVIPWSQASGQQIQLFNGGNSVTFIGTGYPVCVEFGTDIQLQNETYVGMQGIFNFQAQVTVSNYTTSNVNAELHMIVVYDGFMKIENQVVNYNTGLLKTEQGFSIPSLVKMPYPQLTDFYMGGAFSLGSLLSGIGSHLLSGIKGLISGLFSGDSGSEQQGQQTGVTQQLSALLPYIQKMIASRKTHRAIEAPKRSLRRELEEEEEE